VWDKSLIILQVQLRNRSREWADLVDSMCIQIELITVILPLLTLFLNLRNNLALTFSWSFSGCMLRIFRVWNDPNNSNPSRLSWILKTLDGRFFYEETPKACWISPKNLTNQQTTDKMIQQKVSSHFQQPQRKLEKCSLGTENIMYGKSWTRLLALHTL
jgi:hypothetical protein